MEKIIKEKLLEIEEKENVKIIMAIESGSRAWGFASPDSDYDVRFIYVRKKEDYLRLDPVRDVIEWQLDDVLDINGWDVRKALQLLFKCNPTIFEWCASPIVYRTSPEFEAFKALLPKCFSEKKGLFHYWHMADSNYREYLKGDTVRLKKYFYVLRPLLAAKWIVSKQTPPPMLFSELMEAELDAELVPEVERLLDLKMNAPESEYGPKVQIINDYIDKTLLEVKALAERTPEKRCEWEMLDEYFLRLLDL